jgi:hypothetical protein
MLATAYSRARSATFDKENMKKIGNTLAGSVIVEMTVDEYQAITKLQGAAGAPSVAPKDNGKASESMTRAERASYVAERLKKLKPRKRDGVIHSIEAMFQFTGGIPATEVEAVVKALVKSKFLYIDEAGRVTYA